MATGKVESLNVPVSSFITADELTTTTNQLYQVWIGKIGLITGYFQHGNSTKTYAKSDKLLTLSKTTLSGLLVPIRLTGTQDDTCAGYLAVSGGNIIVDSNSGITLNASGWYKIEPTVIVAN